MSVFCFNLVGLSPSLLDKLIEMPSFSRLMESGKKADMEPVFPCLTLPGQASFSTGTYPGEHGIIANGFYDRDRFEVSFWDQYRSLVQAEPVWESLKHNNPNLKTAVLFCQNTLYGNADIIITPKPMHTDEGLVQWCYSKPVGIYEKISRDIGRPFNLMDYWGPFASSKASEWIMEAAISVVKEHLPDFMVTYIPHLDYSCQKFGPDDPRIDDDLKVIDNLMAGFINTLEKMGILQTSTICIFSEYSLSMVTGAVLLNRNLRNAGFLRVREIETREYLDFELSRAFAMVDHQVAHIYVKDKKDIEPVKKLIENIDGVSMVLSEDQKKSLKIDHERSGELVAVSDPDKWFAYYWWEDQEKAPDFAFNIDIHRKPGYDPLELFMDMKTMKIPQTPELIKGSHGAPARDGQGMAVFMLSGKTADKVSLPGTIGLVDVAMLLKNIVENKDI
ncbi:MAG: alkaline phosphatase family protein [Desulfobacula sp.]|jgi:predicted AlkP superfamily pyrophosphatase or phosphodiesterase|nr:alkaline phosphatase family protein [Desulfobacula sp.]